MRADGGDEQHRAVDAEGPLQVRAEQPEPRVLRALTKHLLLSATVCTSI